MNVNKSITNNHFLNPRGILIYFTKIKGDSEHQPFLSFCPVDKGSVKDLLVFPADFEAGSVPETDLLNLATTKEVDMMRQT